MSRVVIALSGNALLRRGDEDSAEVMRKNARMATQRVAEVASLGWELVVTHGKGPQVGRILLQNEAARDWVHPMPLDVCGAESQGQIGCLLQVTIGDVFFERGMERPVATVVTFKVEAAQSFVQESDRRAVICALDDAPEALQGQAGTTIAVG